MLNWRIWTNVWIRVIPRAAPLPCLLHSAWCSESLPCNYFCITSDHLKGSESLCKISGKRPQASQHLLGGWKPPWLCKKCWQSAPFASQHWFNVLFWFHQVVLRLSLPFFSPIHYLQQPSTVEVEENDDMSEAGSQKMVSKFRTNQPRSSGYSMVGGHRLN